MPFSGLFKNIIILALHFLAITTIFFAYQPIAKWYLSKIPALGVDLYYSATYVAYHLKHLSLPFNSFKDIWFGGYPFFNDVFQLPFYLMAPFAHFFGLIEGIRIFVIVVLFGFALCCYLLYQNLSKNVVLAAVLAILVLYSVNIYGAATWGGSLPYFAAQMSLPLVIFFLVKYLANGERRWFFTAIIASGVGALFHPLPVIAFVFPVPFFLLVVIPTTEFSYKIPKRLLDFFIFVFLTVLISLRLFYPYLGLVFDAFIHGRIFGGFGLISPQVAGGAPQPSPGMANFYKSLVHLLITDTNKWLFYFLGAGAIVFILSLIFSNRITRLRRVLAFGLITAYVAGHVVANAYGFGFLGQGWYRAFWAFPVVLGALAAVLWGEFFKVLSFDFSQFNKKIWMRVPIILATLAVSLAFAFLGFYFYTKESKDVIGKIEIKSEVSSAFPEVLSIKVKRNDLEELKKTLVPKFLNPDDKNKRLYDADATVNIWWNAFYDMPLARGYIDPPIGTSDKGGFFLLDIAIANDTLVRDFGYSEEVAYNTSLFLVDWYGVHYFEGGRESSKGPSAGPSSYLVKNGIFETEEIVKAYGAVLKWLTASGKPEVHMDVPQTLHYFKIRDELTSPVLYPSKAPATLVFADKAGYEDLMRVLAASNLNSKYLIPVNGGKFIDDFTEKELSHFRAVILHNYSYHNKKKAFEMLSNFLRQGGKIFVDTGAESKESTSPELPEIFPIKSVKREGLGKTWEFESKEDELTKNVDFNQFGPPIFGQDEWKLAYAPSQASVRDDTTVILKQKGKPILIKQSYGTGEVIWSGLNLLYHINQYKSQSETTLFTNIVKELTPVERHEIVPAQASWYTPEKVILTSQNSATGVLFKEQDYDGWTARLISKNGKKLPIYKVGPTFPGFMYVPLENTKDSQVKVEFQYSGEMIAYFVFFIQILTVIYLLERVLLNGKLFGTRINFLVGKTTKRVKFWWEKEEEE